MVRPWYVTFLSIYVYISRYHVRLRYCISSSNCVQVILMNCACTVCHKGDGTEPISKCHQLNSVLERAPFRILRRFAKSSASQWRLFKALKEQAESGIAWNGYVQMHKHTTHELEICRPPWASSAFDVCFQSCLQPTNQGTSQASMPQTASQDVKMSSR